MKKNVLYILFTVALIMGACYYLYSTNTNYDSGLITSLDSFIFTMPLIAGVSLYQIITGKNKISKQKTWQKILTYFIYILTMAVVSYFWVSSKFYDLSSIIYGILLVLLIPCIYWDYKKGGSIFKNQILNWAVVISSMYLLILGITFAYIQVVSPVTIDQATILVSEKYGDDAYNFVGHLDFNVADNPIGVYWFSPRNANSSVWVSVDLITGDLHDVK